MKRPREPADNLESEATPQVYRRYVGADHKIDLHGPEAALAGSRKRVLAHRARHPASCRPRRGDITAIGHVRAAALLVGLQKIRANNLGVLFRDEDFVAGSKPV